MVDVNNEVTGNAETGSDPGRRRRDAVRAGHNGDRQRARQLSHDPDADVRVVALGARLRLDDLDEPSLLGALSDAEPSVRRRGCSLAGRRPQGAGPAVLAALVGALDDDDPAVAESAASALGEFGTGAGSDAVVGLSTMAAGHGSPLCREAAVAALGAIGAPASLAVVLAALEDTPNIRRRAAIALAAFDDPGAEEGLRRCLGDRDWQVRQAAEVRLADD
jgi:HEAT repeat protein